MLSLLPIAAMGN